MTQITRPRVQQPAKVMNNNMKDTINNEQRAVFCFNRVQSYTPSEQAVK